MAASSAVTLRQPSASGGMADSATGTYGSKPKGVYTSSALLQPNELQDLAALTPEQAKHAEKLDDVEIAASAFELCGAYIGAATDATKRRKKETADDGATCKR